MEQVKLLRRRTTDLLAHAQQNVASTQQSFLSSAQQNLAHAQQSLPALSLPQFPTLRGLGQSSPSAAAVDGRPQGTWERIDDIPALRRSAHSLDIVGGSAYIFGGELDGAADQLADNDMHVVRLPVSGASTDYLRIKAVAETPDEVAGDDVDERRTTTTSSAASSDGGSISSPRAKGKGKERATIDMLPPRPDLGDVPAPRAGHATAVIGSRIFLFGGRAGADGTTEPLDEAGRVWVFDTRTGAWSHLDPAPAVKGGAITIHPGARSGHCAAATDKPRDFGPPTSSSATTSSSTPTPTPAAPPPASPTTLRARALSWRDWAVGDLVAGQQEPAVGHVAESAVDEESRGYGTFFLHAGRLASGGSDRGGDVWAFDVRSRMWSELPAAPGPARAGAAVCVSKSRLFRFGGRRCDDDDEGEEALGGQLDYLPLEVETSDDRRQQQQRGGRARTEVAVRARDGWQTILQRPTSTYSSTVTSSTPLASPTDDSSSGAEQEWPCARRGATLEAVTMGGGREALVLAFGEDGRGQPLGDAWLFQAPTQNIVSAVIGRRGTGEGRWARVAARPHDDEETEMPRARGGVAGAAMNNLEDSGLLVWGGLGEDGKRLGDGWVLRL